MKVLISRDVGDWGANDAAAQLRRVELGEERPRRLWSLVLVAVDPRDDPQPRPRLRACQPDQRHAALTAVRPAPERYEVLPPRPWLEEHLPYANRHRPRPSSRTINSSLLAFRDGQQSSRDGLPH